METLQSIGQILDHELPRDAVHMAVVAVIACDILRPGEGVQIDARGAWIASGGKRIGVVDPFLCAPVNPGERFWLFLNPGSITSLRHDWTHPAFAQEGRAYVPAGASESEAWIRRYASNIGVDYYDLMDGADCWVKSKKTSEWGEYFVQGGTLEGVSTAAEFWPHYEAVRGTQVPDEHKQSFFSCSC